MAALSSCSVLKATRDTGAISFSCVPKTASMRAPKSMIFIRGICGSQKKIEATPKDQGMKPALSRRCVMFTSLSTAGMMLLPRSSSAEEINDKDFREKLLEMIDNLQQLVSKSVGNVKEAVTTKAEEAMSLLKSRNEKEAEIVTEVKSSINETVQQDKLAQN